MQFPKGFTALIMTSDAPLDDAWTAVLPRSIATASESRISEWIGGRIAVQRAFAKAAVRVGADAFKNGSFRKIESNPNWSFSISHTSEWAFAWVTNDKVSIGVDIEDSDREIKPAVAARFAHGNDLALAPILLWSAKEAAFKSVPVESQIDLVVSKIAIGDGTFTISDRDINGFWRQEIAGDLVRSFAWTESK